MEDQTYFLGVEGGGTKTIGVLSDKSGATVRTVQLGAGNISVLGREKTRALIGEMVSRLLQNNPIETIAWGAFGFAGAGRPGEKQILKEILTKSGFRNFTVMTDAELLYEATFAEERGVLLISGTGAVCVIRNHAHQFEQIGGWGYLLGDEGSGYDLGRMAIRQALHEAEQRLPLSTLTAAVVSFYKCTQPEDLITALFATDNPQNWTASCAQLVCKLAENGDAIAREFIRSAAASLIQLCQRAIKRLEAAPPIPLSLAGGILRPNSSVTAAFKQQAHALPLNVNYVQPNMSPAAAGVLHSIRQFGERVDEALVRKMQKLKLE